MLSLTISKSPLLPSEDLAADTEAGTGTEVGMETEMEALRYAHQCPAALRTTHRIPRHQRRHNHPVAVVATLKVIIIIIVVSSLSPKEEYIEKAGKPRRTMLGAQTLNWLMGLHRLRPQQCNILSSQECAAQHSNFHIFLIYFCY